MSMRSSQHLPCESLELNRSPVGKTANSLLLTASTTHAPLAAWLDPSLEPRRSAVLTSALATGPPAGVGGGLGPFLAA